MDRLEQLGSQISQLTMYDVKSFYNQARNYVLNVSEMEGKVREATNDDPWGASSTLMQEIAQGQQFNEIMPAIYNRFMEKEARQWRQIYKALQLLEYIVKHGSERVVDDARAHLATIKMLRNFHYIDDKGKDQGVNIRNRSRELAELLQDVEKIRTERRKAKTNRNKYVGTGNEGSSFGSSGRYGGFGSDSVSPGYTGYGNESGGYSGSTYDRDYGGSSSEFRDQTARRGFDEYDAGDDEEAAHPRSSISATRQSTSDPIAPPPPPAAAKPKEVNLLDMLEDDTTVSVGRAPAAVPSAPAGDFDDFDDFQAAPMSPHVGVSSVPAAPAKTGGAGLFDLLDSTPAPARTAFSPPMTTSAPSMMATQPQRPMMPAAPMQSFTSNNSGMLPSALTGPAKVGPSAATTTTASKPAGAFDDLWSMSLGSSAPKPTSTAVNNGNKSMLDLQREKAQANLWGQAAGGTGTTTKPAGSGGFDDLLL
ncbi:ENTH-domain-containing protein [Dacryopinax primogenitus]|uniref:ENTH-domain-containing protein n=1 Tax=Dacryopinax primogenitus (strain DJM 731) TaxID=1858805 RepID=M5FY03_DACPD|nr:ENTH-domain-containing protein [Dacryopinax primogenitus]EJU02936.1 ENTH-domain-containing protein [Dacryopinax primogenitus]